MKSIQEKRIEKELSALEKNNSLIPTIVSKINKDEYHINITIPSSLLNNTGITSPLFFLLHIQKNFPFTAPRLYCKTPFSYPSLCDARNILDEVISAQWDNQYKLTEIVNSIPKFIIDYLQMIQQNKVSLVGSYYLDDKYDLDFIGSLPVFLEKVKEKVVMSGKETEVSRYIMITDIFFLLFDYGYDILWNRNAMTLVFWSNLRSLMTIKKMVQGDTCEFIWRIKNEKAYSMRIRSEENIQRITDLVMKNLKQFGIGYSVTKSVIGEKKGVVPAIDIEMVEKQVIEVEERIVEDKTSEQLLFLMTLYEKAVEYYSATNNPRYNVFMKKIQDAMAQPEYNKLLEVNEEKEKRNEGKGLLIKHDTTQEMIGNEMNSPSVSLPGPDPEPDEEEKTTEPSKVKEDNEKEEVPEVKQSDQNNEEHKLKEPDHIEEKKKEPNQSSTSTIKINIKSEDLDLDFDDDES